MTFDPNAAADADSGVFGLPQIAPHTENEASLVFIPVPWEATTSYGGGTSEGPSAILKASKQVDLFDLDVTKPYEPGLFMLKESAEIRVLSEEAKAKAQARKMIEVVNSMGEKLNVFVFEETRKILKKGKIAAIVGGDHSVPFGAFQAVAEKYPSFGILHFDAHSDTRIAYEGFQWSHASIMHNALSRIPQITKLVQVGIRDVCEQEIEYCASQGRRVEIFFDRDLQHHKFEGQNWGKTAEEIISYLPQDVWISFDIDGLDPRFCPHTGTPVPGGLDFAEAVYLIRTLAKSGRNIIGFDLNEVAPASSGENEWDANVGARLLYKLTDFTLASQGKVELRR
ncbi:agmatinase family protein [Bdellovibrionota bacterium FG-1]